MKLTELLRSSDCKGVVAMNLVDTEGRVLDAASQSRRPEADGMLSDLWQVAREYGSLDMETMMTTDYYVLLIRPVGGGVYVQMALDAYDNLEAARHLLTRLENKLPDIT